MTRSARGLSATAELLVPVYFLYIHMPCNFLGMCFCNRVYRVVSRRTSCPSVSSAVNQQAERSFIYTFIMSLHIDSTHSRRPRRAVHSGLGKNGPDKNGPGKNGPEKTVRGII